MFLPQKVTSDEVFLCMCRISGLLDRHAQAVGDGLLTLSRWSDSASPLPVPAHKPQKVLLLRPEGGARVNQEREEPVGIGRWVSNSVPRPCRSRFVWMPATAEFGEMINRWPYAAPFVSLSDGYGRET
jgi:hypothetical protein